MQPVNTFQNNFLQRLYYFFIPETWGSIIPSFSAYARSSVMQRYKLEEGQKSFGKRVDVSAKNDEIINRMTEIHGQEKPKHGAVAADEAAKAYIAKKAFERD